MIADEFIDHYEVLEVSPGARPSVIQSAYKRLMLEEHPDRGGSTARAQQINRAYEVLSDAAARHHFDRERSTRLGAERTSTPREEHGGSRSRAAQQQAEHLRKEREAEVARREADRLRKERADAHRAELDRLLTHARAPLFASAATIYDTAWRVPVIMTLAMSIVIAGDEVFFLASVRGESFVPAVIYAWLLCCILAAFTVAVVLVRVRRAMREFSVRYQEFQQQFPTSAPLLRETWYRRPMRSLHFWPLYSLSIMAYWLIFLILTLVGVAISGIASTA